MGKSKTGTNIFLIIFKSLIIYLKNFLPLSRVMLFPVFGQMVGLFLIFYPNYLYIEKYLGKISGETIHQNLAFVILGLILILIPGFAVFLKAFWDYMIVTVSLNNMISDIVKKGNFTNFKVYNNSVKLRTGNYVMLLLIIMLLWLLVIIFPFSALFFGNFINTVLIVPIFFLMVVISIIFLIILSVNLSLAFQVFAFESITGMDVIKRSWTLMKGNFWRTVFMGTVLLLITCLFVPGLVNSLVEKSSFISYLMLPFESYIDLFSKNPMFIELLSKYNLTAFGFAEILTLSVIGTIITAMMLPWGSAAFTLLYYDAVPRAGKSKLPAEYEKLIMNEKYR